MSDAESNGFADGRRALIPASVFLRVDASTRRFCVALTKDKVRDSPAVDTDRPVSRRHERFDHEPDDTHLRSAEELFGYRVQATDGRIGRVDDFIVDDETWDVRYLVVETSAWWFGKSVLIAPTWARRMIWTTGLLGS